MHRRLIIVLVGGLLVSGLCGCYQERFTRQKYETIYVAMPDWQVRNVLGEPTEVTGEQWTYVHEMPYCRATVTFKDGLVVDKAWSHARP